MKTFLSAQKMCLLLAVLLLPATLGTSFLKAQSYSVNQNKMILTRENKSTDWSIRLKASYANQESVWIDWNNNGSYEEGEAYDFGQYNNSHAVVSQTITIYGKVTMLSAPMNYLTAVDVRSNDALEELQIGNNKIQTLDLTNNPKLFNLICQNNQIEQLDCSSNKVLRRLSCYTNHIQGENMWRLVRSLVDRKGQERAGKIHIIDSRMSTERENIATKKQVAELVGKNWEVFDWKDGEEEGENPYTGTPDPDDNNYTTQGAKVVLHASEATGNWSLRLGVEEENRNTCWLDLNNDGKYQKGEELKKFETMMEIPREAATLAMYGKYSSITCSDNKLTSIDFGNDASALRSLTIENNALVALDLATASHLEYLNCDKNSIVSLNLSNLANLREVTCFANKLKTLNIKGCSALLKLTCNDNQLTEIDFTGVNLLSELYCSGNQISALNLDEQTALRSLYCNNNKLASLVFKNKTELEILYCLGNNLSTLDFAGMPLLSVVNCAQNNIAKLSFATNPKMTKIYAYENKLTELDFSGLDLLAFVDVSNNQITGLTFKKNESLNDLHCSFNRLTGLNLTETPALLRLVCNDNQIAELNLASLSHLVGFRAENNRLKALDFKACSALAKAYVQGNQIQGKAMTDLINSLPARDKETMGVLTVVDLKATQEGNVCMDTDVALATKKFWNVQDYNGGTSHPYGGKPTSIEEVAQLQVSLFPNPAHEVAYVSGATPNEKIALYALDGVRIAETVADMAGNARFDVATLAVGTYIVKGSNWTSKLIVE